MPSTICVLGGGGFVGTALVTRLANAGHDVIVPSRNRERRRQLLVLPNVQLTTLARYDAGSLTALFAGCDAVINLVGILNGSEEQFRRAHAELPVAVVDACVQAGVPRLLHMSALNAGADSDYLRSKGEGENAAHAGAERGLRVTSFQPSVIFGPNDGFFNRFAALLKLTPALPLACPDARFAPVYIGDVVAAFVAALHDPASVGKRYQLCGPRVYTLRELVGYCAELLGKKRVVIGLSDGMSRRQAGLFDLLCKPLPVDPPLSRDNYRSLQFDSVCSGDRPGLAELGIAATSIESVMPRLFRGDAARHRYDRFRRFGRR